MEVYIDNSRSGKSHKKCNPYSECKCSESVNFLLSCFQISGNFCLFKNTFIKDFNKCDPGAQKQS